MLHSAGFTMLIHNHLNLILLPAPIVISQVAPTQAFNLIFCSDLYLCLGTIERQSEGWIEGSENTLELARARTFTMNGVAAAGSHLVILVENIHRHKYRMDLTVVGVTGEGVVLLLAWSD